MTKNKNHPALVRNDKGNLDVRYFDNATDAARAAAHLEAPEVLVEVQRASGPTRPLHYKKFAERIGAPSRVVRAAFKRGALPGAIQHSDRIILVPAALVKPATIYGLMGMERRIKAGLMSA
jgi:hypothetical protein